MSIRVYTGFKFVSREMRDIVISLETVKEDIEQLQRNRYLTAYACLMVSILDRSQHAVRSGKTEGMVTSSPGRQARDAIGKRQAKVRATCERDPAVDLEVELRCWHSRQLDEVIGYVYGEFSQEVLTLLRDKGVVTDYAYWNSSEQDEYVSEQEWAQREAAWDEALYDKTGARFDFRFDSVTSGMRLKWTDVEPFVPSLEFRTRELVEPELFSNWYAALPDKAPESNDVLQRHTEFRKLLREDAAMMERLAADIAQCMPLLLVGDALNGARSSSQLLMSPNDFDF